MPKSQGQQLLLPSISVRRNGGERKLTPIPRSEFFRKRHCELYYAFLALSYSNPGSQVLLFLVVGRSLKLSSWRSAPNRSGNFRGRG